MAKTPGGKKRPLYRTISDALRRRLTDGDLAAGARVPALRELATQFNVSTITVRQALRMLEEEGRLHCIPGVGTFVRPSLPRRSGTDQVTVAFATIMIEGAFTSEIAHSIEEACQQRGWGMQLLNAQGDPQLEARNLSRIAKSGVNGAIVLPVCDSENIEEMVKLKLASFPFVLVDRAIPGVKVDVVASDHEAGAHRATEYLIEHGHRRVLMVTEPPTTTAVAARIRGYEQALLDHGIEPLREWKVWMDPNAYDRENRQRFWLPGKQATLPVLQKLEPPMAIFALNCYIGWGVYEACRILGLNVPDDVSIICFDDSEFTRALSPGMTAISQRTGDIGRTAVELLEHRLSSATAFEPRQVQIDVDLIERGSVAILSAP